MAILCTGKIIVHSYISVCLCRSVLQYQYSYSGYNTSYIWKLCSASINGWSVMAPQTARSIDLSTWKPGVLDREMRKRPPSCLFLFPCKSCPTVCLPVCLSVCLSAAGRSQTNFYYCRKAEDNDYGLASWQVHPQQVQSYDLGATRHTYEVVG